MPVRRNSIEIVINATDNASDVLRGIGTNAGEIGKVVVAAFAGVAVGIGAAMAGAVTQGLAEFQKFEVGMNEVFSLLPGISEAAMSQMEGDIQNLSARLGILSEDAIPALYQAISAGVPQDNVFEFMDVAGRASIAGAVELETVVDGLSTVLNSYSLDASHAEGISDQMFTAVRLGKTTFDELSGSMFQMVPILASMNGEFSEGLGAITAITQQGVPTSVAMTQMRAALSELADSGSDVSKVFQEVTGTSFRDFLADGGSMVDAIGILEQASIDLGIPLDNMFGSIEAGQGILAITGANFERFASTVEDIQNSTGATQTAFEQMNQGIGRAMDRLRANMQNLFINIGALAAPLITPLIDVFTTISYLFGRVLQDGEYLDDALLDIPKAIRPIIGAALRLAAGFRQLATDLDPNNPNGFFGALNAGVPLFAVVITQLRRVMSAMGFSTVIIDMVANALITLRNAFSQVKTFIMGLLAPVIEWVKQNIELKDVLIALGIAVAAFVIPAIVSIIAAVAPLIATFALLVGAVALIRNAWEDDWNGIKTFIEGTVLPFFSNLVTAFQEGGLAGVGQFLFDSLKTGISNIDWTAIGTTLWDLLKSAVTTAITIGTWVYDNLILPLFNAAKERFAAIDWGEVGSSIMDGLGAALDLLIAGATWVNDNIVTPLVTKLGEAWASIDWSAVGQSLLDALGSALTTLGTWATWVYDNVLVPMKDNAQTAIENVDWYSIGSGIVNAIGAALQATFDFVMWLINSIFAPTVEGSEDAAGQTDWSRVGNAILNAIGTFLTGTFNFVMWLFTNVLTPLVLGAADAIAQTDWSAVGTGIMDALGNALGNVAQWAADNIINPIRNALTGFNPMDTLPTTAGSGVNASGGIFASGGFQFGGQVSAGVPIRVGEGGSETFVPQTDGTILNAQDTEAMRAGGSPITIQFVFQRSISDNEARESASKLKRELQAQGISVEGTF